MLRFANIVLSNPAKPELPAIRCAALVTDDAFGLSIGPAMVEKLQLEQIALREVKEVGESARLLPYVGPLRITYRGREAFAGAISHVPGVAIGQELAHELQITEAEAPAAVSLRSGIIIRGKAAGPADKILVKENAVDAETCRSIIEHIAPQPRRRAGVVAVKHGTTTGIKSFINQADRDTFEVPLDEVITKQLRTLFYKVMTEYIEPFYGITVEWWENPGLLSYEPGGHYGAHADADRWINKPGGGGVWERYMDRDISLLLYLNDNFTGGALNFPGQELKIQPKPGLLVAFPSSADYRHGAMPTESGERLVLVTWAAAVGSPRVRKKPKHVIYMEPMHEQHKAGDRK